MKKYLICLISFILLVTFSSCAPTIQRIPLSRDAALNINGKTLEITQPKTPNFYAQTTGKAWLPPMIGIATSFSGGRELVAENDIEDPAVVVSEEIGKILTKHFNMIVLPKSKTISESSDIDTLCRTYSNGDVLLDVRTTGWSFGTGGSIPAFSKQYGVILGLRLKVIDVKLKKILAEESFMYTTATNSNRTFTFDELMNNSAEGLKSELRNGTDEAILYFKERALNL
jgi:hypothetical protein